MIAKQPELNDDLSDLIGNSPVIPFQSSTGTSKAPPASYQPPEQLFREGCPKCFGSGQTRWGVCFRCKGKGGKTFKTSPQERATNRAKAMIKREAQANERATELQAKAEAWSAANLDIAKWLGPAAQRGFNFAQSLIDALSKYGSLTDNQMAAARRCIEQDKQRAEQASARVTNAATVDVAKIEAAFTRAKSDAYSSGEGIMWLKLRLDTFTFTDAPAGNGFPAAILVKEGSNKLGRIVGGKFIRSRTCDDATEARVIAAAADPAAAAKAYGLRTKQCSCCGRTLTNAESRELGIGPICAGRFFG